MSFEAARADMVTAAQAALATWVGPPSPLVLSYQNRALVDPDHQLDPYLCVDMYHLDGEQLSLGGTVVLANYGQIHLVAHARENAGTLLCQRILDHFGPYFELQTFSMIRTHASRGAASYSKGGWECWPLIIPFWYHRLVT
jgi:hypothetical protein